MGNAGRNDGNYAVSKAAGIPGGSQLGPCWESAATLLGLYWDYAGILRGRC